MKKLLPALLLILLLFTAGIASAEKEAPDLTSQCTISLTGNTNVNRLRDHKFTTYLDGKSAKNAWVKITSPEPVYGLYLCFRNMPAYEVQVDRGEGWETVAEGNPEYLHAFYELDGATQIRIQAVAEKAVSFGFNEITVFGEGKIPEWVQRWEPTPEKADLLFVIGNPDEEALYLGGAIPVYACEQHHSVALACIGYDNPSRRSELLNSLWSMGYRSYPIINKVAKPERKISNATIEFVVGAVRRCRPEVIVTMDEKGEGNNANRKIAAEVCKLAFDRAAEGENPWQAKKLYLHLYGNDPTVLDWSQPLESQKGLDGLSVARRAYLYYKTQDDTDKDVMTNGKKYANTTFGLYKSLVGEDTAKNDFLENIPESDLTPGPEWKDLSVDKAAGVLPELNEKGYLNEGEFIYSDDAGGLYIYISPTAKVIINRRFDGALPLTWFESEIWVDTEAGEYMRNIERDPELRHKARGDAADTALKHHVVFAVNGDYYTYRIGAKNGHPVGIEIRGGNVYYSDQYDKKTDFFPNLDTLAFYQDGHLEVHHSYELKPKDYLDSGAYDVYSFGPFLIKNGEFSEWVTDATKTRAKNPRHALGMLEPGHYMDIMVEGRLGSRSEGVTMYQLAIMAKTTGMTECCNLDGGQTAVVVFMGKQLNQIGVYDGKTNARPTCEVIGVGISDQVGVFEVK